MSTLTIAPPKGYLTWLDYAVATMDTRSAHLQMSGLCEDGDVRNPVPSRDDIQVAAADELRQLRARLEQAEGLLRGALNSAEWHEKRIYVVGGPTVQNWKLDIYLPILADSDMSAEHALERALGEKA
jgi:hypothetical protein